MFVGYLFHAGRILYRRHIHNILFLVILKLDIYIYIYLFVYLCSIYSMNISAHIANTGAPMFFPNIVGQIGSNSVLILFSGYHIYNSDTVTF
jgi:hypothetical protein